MENYQLIVRGNPVIKGIPQIDNHRYDEAREEILAKHNERFKGDSRIVDTNDYEEGQSLTHSSTPRALSYEQRAKELGITDFHVLSPKEVVMYWPVILERDETYADTNSVAIYPNPSEYPDNETLRKRVLDILKEIHGINTDIDVPLIVLGLDPIPPIPVENDYGFTFEGTDYTNFKEAPFLSQDGKVKYEDGRLVQSEDGVPIWVPGDQSGLRGLCRYRSGVLYAGGDDLLDSDGAGRVQILYDPKGRRKNLEALVENLQEERDRQIAEINARYESSLEHLKTGKKF